MYCGGTFRETDETCPNCEEPTAPILRKKPAPRELVFQTTRTKQDGKADTADKDGG
ncbi:hypothetical protein GCM10011363_40360 [Marivita lacus]|uniref:Zinc ribbon domain-containing protein n=1 Tax=Marivita lacus TaxID=1323742 RepID=A0ABQ1L4W4_9RHOB|nr:hypothetical protein GCM10011363_40360 [Marivita lacus]